MSSGSEAGLYSRLGPDLQDEDERLGVGDTTQKACAMVFFVFFFFFFFFSFVAGGQTAGEERVPSHQVFSSMSPPASSPLAG